MQGRGRGWDSDALEGCERPKAVCPHCTVPCPWAVQPPFPLVLMASSLGWGADRRRPPGALRPRPYPSPFASFPRPEHSASTQRTASPHPARACRFSCLSAVPRPWTPLDPPQARARHGAGAAPGSLRLSPFSATLTRPLCDQMRGPWKTLSRRLAHREHHECWATSTVIEIIAATMLLESSRVQVSGREREARAPQLPPGQH